MLLINLRVIALLVKSLTPSFGQYAATEAALTGSLRATHSRLLEHSEEIALFGGEETEKMLVERDYFALVKHINMVLRRRLWHGVVEEGIVKWMWGCFGVCCACITCGNGCLTLSQLCICAIPVFFKLPGIGKNDLGGRTESKLPSSFISSSITLYVRFRNKPQTLALCVRCLWPSNVLVQRTR